MNTCVLVLFLALACVVSGLDFAIDQNFHDAIGKSFESIHDRARRAVKDVDTERISNSIGSLLEPIHRLSRQAPDSYKGILDFDIPLSRVARSANGGGPGGPGGPRGPGGPGGPRGPRGGRPEGQRGPGRPWHKGCCGDEETGFFNFSAINSSVMACVEENRNNQPEVQGDRRKCKRHCIVECVAKKEAVLDAEGNIDVGEAIATMLKMITKPDWQTELVIKACGYCINKTSQESSSPPSDEREDEGESNCSKKPLKFFKCVMKDIEKNCPGDHKRPGCENERRGPSGGPRPNNEPGDEDGPPGDEDWPPGDEDGPPGDEDGPPGDN